MSRGFRIKPLVWRFFDVKSSFGHGVWDANGINITYSIEDVSETFSSDPFYCSRLSKQFASLEEAQLAVQAHHEDGIHCFVETADDLLAALLAEDEADAAFDAADEYTHRADAEGWLNDPTGSLHVNEAWDRANDLRAKAKELRRAAIAKATA